jgi:hypothetical protein
MDKYTLFCKLMDIIGDDYEVTYAYMNSGSDFGISVEGEADGKRIKISATTEDIKDA